MKLTWLFCLLLMSACLLLSGCSTWIRFEQPMQTGSIALERGGTIGQTFTAHYAGLEGVSLFIQPVELAPGSLDLRLYKNAGKEVELARSTLDVTEIQKPGWYRFAFPPIKESNQEDYFFEVGSESPGRFDLSTGTGDVYLDGALYQDGLPVDAQATFRLAYAPVMATTGLAREGLAWLGWLLAGIGLFILPGWGILAVLYSDWDTLSWVEKAGLAGGLSLAIYPLLFLWTHLVGLNLGRIYAWLPALSGVGLILFKRIRQPQRNPREKLPTANILPRLASILLLALIIFSRMWVIRGLVAPMWGDSLQHTMIAQLFVDNQGLFNSWEPYTALTTFTYHFGFHTLAAVYHWETSLPTTTSTLWTGQLINILAIIALVPLANRLGKNQWAGVAAILVAGLLAPMPQEYTNWGRYTQLAGQVILPAVVYISWNFLERELVNWKSAALVWMLMGGLALTHYRILIFAILFYLTYFITMVWKRGTLELVLRTFLAGIGGALLFLPWFIHVFSGKILNLLSSQLSTPVGEISQFTIQYNAIGNLTSFLSPILWFLLVVVIVWGLWKREGETIRVILWWLMILLAANPAWIGLPGTGAIGSFTVLIAAYIPAGLLLGAAIGWLANANIEQGSKHKWLPIGLEVMLALAILGFGIWGSRQRLKDIRPDAYALLTRPDQRASAWVKQNLPIDAKFLVNAFFAFGNSVIVGADGGWWLPLTAEREITLPPINYGNEQGPTPDYRQWVNELQTEIESKGILHPDVINSLRQRQVEYVYIGQRQGEVGNTGVSLNPLELLDSPYFKLIYQQDRVYIFKLTG